MEQVVARKAAENEIEKWLEWRKVMPGQRESLTDAINTLTEGIQYGVLKLDDKFSFTQKLHFSIGDGTKIESLNYKPRINGTMLKPYLQGIKPGDADARITAVLQCLTGEAREILNALDPADMRIANSIVVFFLG